MHRRFITTLALSVLVTANAAAQALSTPPSGDNQKSSVTQHIGLVACERGEGVTHRGEGARDRGEQPLARFGKAYTPLLAHEERAAEPVLQLTDLIADRRLRHPELFGGAREILEAPGGFKGSYRGKGRQLGHATL